MNCMDDTRMNLSFSPKGVRMGNITIRLPSTFEINHQLILFRKWSIFILCICDGAVSLDFRLILFQQHFVQYVISSKSWCGSSKFVSHNNCIHFSLSTIVLN